MQSKQTSTNKPESRQNARIIIAHALIANVTATIIAFDAGCNILTNAISIEMIIVANITIAGAMIHGIESAISKICSTL